MFLKKTKILLQIMAVASLSMAVGCTHQQKKESPKDEKSTYIGKDLTAVPLQADGTIELKEGETVDPTYLRTQADYYFSVGESYSLEGNSQKAIEAFKLAAVYDTESPDVYLRLATEYVRSGLLSEGIEQAENGLQKDPQHRDLHLFVGGLYATMKVYNKALEHYKFLLVQNPQDQSVQLYVGALYADQEEFGLAREAFIKSTKVTPEGDTENKAHLAFLYLAKLELLENDKSHGKAEKWLKSALKSKANFAEAARSLAGVYEAKGQNKKAIKYLETYQRTQGPDEAIAEMLSQHYLKKEDYKKALVHLRVMEEFDPSNLSVQMKIALILIEQKVYDDAIDRLERILTMTPESDKVRYYLAAVYEETEDTNLAIQNYGAIDAVSTYYPDASMRAANLLKESKNLKGAQELIEKAISFRADSSNLFSFYAALLEESKQYKKGIKVLEQAEKKFPNNLQVKYYLGNFYDRTEKKEQTISKMREIIEKDPNHFAALNYLSYTLAEMGSSLVEAESLALRALDLQPNNAYILDTVGWVYYKKGNAEEAIRYLEAAHNKKPNESIIAEHLGDAYYVYQLTDKAKEMYIKAARLETDIAKVEEIQQKIRNIQGPQRDRIPASVSRTDKSEH